KLSDEGGQKLKSTACRLFTIWRWGLILMKVAENGKDITFANSIFRLSCSNGDRVPSVFGLEGWCVIDEELKWTGFQYKKERGEKGGEKRESTWVVLADPIFLHFALYSLCYKSSLNLALQNCKMELDFNFYFIHIQILKWVKLHTLC
ncbi:hypothetical protein PanWU01x14_207160, partial [Parasponia andersonii]